LNIEKVDTYLDWVAERAAERRRRQDCWSGSRGCGAYGGRVGCGIRGGCGGLLVGESRGLGGVEGSCGQLVGREQRLRRQSGVVGGSQLKLGVLILTQDRK
jgi:hypothetical protein